MKKLLTLLVMAILLSACGTSAPKCSSSDAENSVTKMIEEELYKSLGKIERGISYLVKSNGLKFQSDYFDKVKFTLVNIRTTKINEKLGSFECKAEISSKFDTNEIRKPISFTSEQTNGGEDYYIQVMGLSEEDKGALLSVLVVKDNSKEEEALIERTIANSEELSMYKNEAYQLYNKINKINDFDIKKELPKRNKCAKDSNIKACLSQFYEQYLAKIATEVIKKQEEGGYYLSVKNVKYQNGKFLYLANGFQYSFGVISNDYWSALFDGENVIKKSSICSIANDEEGKFKSGNEECDDKYIKKIFKGL